MVKILDNEMHNMKCIIKSALKNAYEKYFNLIHINIHIFNAYSCYF